MLSPIASTVVRARRLRRKMTLPEVILWRELRQRPEGLKFRRQHPAGHFVHDFYCESARRGIEIDGLAHDMGDNPERDRKRDQWLQGQGIEMLRIPATDVLNHLDEAIQLIVATCQPLHHPRSGDGPPPLQGGIL